MSSNLSDERILEIARATLDTAMRLRVNIEREGLLAFARAILTEGSAASAPGAVVEPPEPVAWLLSGSHLVMNRVFLDKRQAVIARDNRKDGSIISPLYAAPVVPSSEPPEPLTSDQQYWLRRRPAIIEALAAEGWEIWVDEARVWLHEIRGHPTESDSSKPEAAGEVEIRLDDDGALDEIVGGTGVHLEQMDTNHWWLAVYYPGGRVTCGLHARGKITAFVEREPDVKTEGGGANTKP